MDVREARRWQALLAVEGSAARMKAAREIIWRSPGDPFEALLNQLELSEFDRERINDAAGPALEAALAAGVRFLPWDQFPDTLRTVPGSPSALAVWGDFEPASAPAIGIVGTRGASAYGKAVAAKFAEAFARAGVTVVSGGALGIDAAAHQGALQAGGKTIAVLAGGVDKVYPAIHRPLFARIRENGCLVSPFAIGFRPTPYRFLARNHVIAGLSRAVLVVEVPTRSGALRTAHASCEMGREVFVVPANIDNLNFQGSHALIRDGATLVDHPDQVLQALGLGNAPAAPKPQASSIGEKILTALETEPITLDKLAERCDLPSATLMAELTLLELEGMVCRHPGGFSKPL